MEELAIKVEHVSKQYRLGTIGGGTLKGDLESWWAKKRGKEDPNSKIGTDTKQRIGEKFLALDDITFNVKKGETVGIIGHNGAGKSTLLKLLSRVTAPSAGKISFNGRIASMLEVGTGFHPELTGRENVYMNGAILGMTKVEINRKLNQIVSFAEMEQFIDTPVKRYSSGMYVKLAFSVAAHLDSEIMVMDEVLAVGDMKFQQKCLGRMGDAANNEGRTVLYVSHNMNTIRQLCDRVIVLKHGKIVFDGEVEQGIGIYMEDIPTPRLENDCRSLSRHTFHMDNKIHINHLRFLEVVKPEYTKSDTIEMEVEFTATQELEDICLRIPFFYYGNTPIGMASTASVISCKKGENRLKLFLQPQCLAPGRYSMRLVLFSINEFGTTVNHDVVDSAAVFDLVAEENDIMGLNWEHRYWGAIQFPEIKVGYLPC